MTRISVDGDVSSEYTDAATDTGRQVVAFCATFRRLAVRINAWMLSLCNDAACVEDRNIFSGIHGA